MAVHVHVQPMQADTKPSRKYNKIFKEQRCFNRERTFDSPIQYYYPADSGNGELIELGKNLLRHSQEKFFRCRNKTFYKLFVIILLFD